MARGAFNSGSFSPSACLAQLDQAEPSVRRWVIALSGGLDSMVLLHAASQVWSPQSLHVLHVHHQLQSAADTWSDFCVAQAQARGLSCQVIRVAPTSASEADARAARYQAFQQVLQVGDCLLLAQHADDQAETLFFRLLRGAGVRGLAAMPAWRQLGCAELRRPFLSWPRQALKAWAESERLSWIEDPSNLQDHYARNFLRLQILPRLQKRWPALVTRCLDTAQQMSEASELLDELAAQDLERLIRGRDSLCCLGLRSLSLARQSNVLRFWLRQVGQTPSQAQLHQVQQQLLSTHPSEEACVELSAVHLRVYREQLYRLPNVWPEAYPMLSHLQLAPGQVLSLPGGRLYIQGQAEVPLCVNLRYRRLGEKLYLPGREHSTRLKHLFQAHGVPVWQREGWPLLESVNPSEPELLAVAGLVKTRAWPEDCGLEFEWRPFSLSEQPFFASL
ncbi:tRNA lysidine(34) synthetase TilS [Nitrincola tapanii]|uniref:tRNA(Ile)-lysidine synthase n=1 Tax=Nitrincola tapanii TaxID=1708751 RepID=A0A5A9W3A2_9GAMM|nr:tRNA lysidine(34) synthetase TilS [Nitrincola tapanii]KAA0874679.1 tRNA lysidine(34) synthetase TilS [Nitrincola tapanii]